MITTSDPDDPLLDMQDLAARLGVKLKTVHHYRTQGRLPDPDAFAGRSPLWRKKTIAGWEAGRRGHGWRKGLTEPDADADS